MEPGNSESQTIGYMLLPKDMLQHIITLYPVALGIESAWKCTYCNNGPCCEHLAIKLRVAAKLAVDQDGVTYTNFSMDMTDLEPTEAEPIYPQAAESAPTTAACNTGTGTPSVNSSQQTNLSEADAPIFWTGHPVPVHAPIKADARIDDIEANLAQPVPTIEADIKSFPYGYTGSFYAGFRHLEGPVNEPLPTAYDYEYDDASPTDSSYESALLEIEEVDPDWEPIRTTPATIKSPEKCYSRKVTPKKFLRKTNPISNVAECTFCHSNRESEEVYLSHILKKNGIICCPVLRKFVCPICKATGDNAHTEKYCPEGIGRSVVPKTALNSCGKKPYILKY